MNYEDNQCQMSEGPDDPCRREATQTFREPFTPAGFKVNVCDEHAGHCRMFGYRSVLVFPVEAPRLNSLREVQSQRDIRQRFPSAFRKARRERIRTVRLENDLFYVARRADGHGRYLVRFFDKGADVTVVCSTLNNERCKGTYRDRCCVHIACAIESGIKHGRKRREEQAA